MTPLRADLNLRWTHLLFAASLLLAPAACDGPCPGGYQRTAPDGGTTCEGLCSPSLCKDPQSACVGNACAPLCTADTDCPVGQACAAATADGTGASVTVCRATGGGGGVGTPCPLGSECAALMTCGDGTPCPSSGACAVGVCRALTCYSTGVGDTAAYCTLLDCHGDADCGGGFWCKPVREPDAICGQPAPALVCGTTTDPCVDPSMNAATGATWAAGALCTLRNVCRQRGLCDPCTADLDCSRQAGYRCVSGSCLPSCAGDGDCVNGLHCVSGACTPRDGSCAPATPGTGAVCSPCRTEADCAAGLYCWLPFVGELRVCAAAPGVTPCTADAQCPTGPSGAHVACYDDAFGASSGEPGYDTCYLAPYNATLNQFLCACQNPGAGCAVDADCCSSHCTIGNGDAGASPIGVCQ